MKPTQDTPGNQQWVPEEGLASNNDVRPPQAIPAEGQSASDSWSGFASKDKFSNQGSKPYKADPFKE
jgi:hypothetical protein